MVGVNPEDQSDDNRAVKQPQYPWAQRGYHLSAPYRTFDVGVRSSPPQSQTEKGAI